jgi:hypothetical protein
MCGQPNLSWAGVKLIFLSRGAGYNFKTKSKKEMYFLDLSLNFQVFTQKHMFYTTIHDQKL